MESKHTPGPWRVDHDGLTVLGDDNGISSIIVTRLVSSPPGFATKHADASLIAAAPELLDALRVAETRLLVYAEWCDREFIASRGTRLLDEIRKGAKVDANDARAIIAKAEGRAS